METRLKLEKYSMLLERITDRNGEILKQGMGSRDWKKRD